MVSLDTYALSPMRVAVNHSYLSHANSSEEVPRHTDSQVHRKLSSLLIEYTYVWTETDRVDGSTNFVLLITDDDRMLF